MRTRVERLHTEQTSAVVCGKPREEVLRVVIGETGTSKHSTGCKETKRNLSSLRSHGEPRRDTPCQHSTREKAVAASPCNTGSPGSKGIPLAPLGSPQLAPGRRHPAPTWLCLPRTGPRRRHPSPPRAAERQRGLTEAEPPAHDNLGHV